MPKDDETDKWSKTPSEHSLRAMSEKDLMLCAIAEMRQGNRANVNQDRINQAVQTQMQAVQGQLADGGKVMALLHMEVKQLAEDMAETDATVRGLEKAEDGRVAIEREGQKQPGFVKLAVIVAILSSLGTALVTIIFHLIKTTPGVAP